MCTDYTISHSYYYFSMEPTRAYMTPHIETSETPENTTNPVDRSQLQEKTLQQNPSTLLVNNRSNRPWLLLVYDRLSEFPLKTSGNNLPFLKFYCRNFEYIWNGEIWIEARWYRRSRIWLDNYTEMPPFTNVVPTYNPEFSTDLNPETYTTPNTSSRIRNLIWIIFWTRVSE